MSQARALLVIGPSWIGDIVMSQCLYSALLRDRPGLAIDVMAPEAVRPLVERMRDVRKFIPSPFGHGEFAFGRRTAFGRQLKGKYEEAVILPGSWKSALVPFFAGIPRRSGYLREWRWGLLNDIRYLPSDFKRKTALGYQALCDPLVLENPQRLLRPSLRIDQQNQRRLLDRLTLSADAYVCLAPGAEFGSAKRWPVRHWSDLAEEFSRIGLRTVIIGSAKELPLAEVICSKVTGSINLAGQTDLGDLIDLVAGSRIVVANDSGVMHLAAAAGTRVIGLFGSTSPEDTPPLSPSARAMSLGLSCSPCNKRECPLGHHDCLEKLTVDRVMAEARSLVTI